jgi:hypothetical protein
LLLTSSSSSSCHFYLPLSWTDHVRNEEVLLRVNEQRNILHEIRKRKANWIGHILRRNCLLKQVIEVVVGTKPNLSYRLFLRFSPSLPIIWRVIYKFDYPVLSFSLWLCILTVWLCEGSRSELDKKCPKLHGTRLFSGAWIRRVN